MDDLTKVLQDDETSWRLMFAYDVFFFLDENTNVLEN